MNSKQRMDPELWEVYSQLTAIPAASAGELDLMRDENVEYAARLMRAAVSTELHVWPGAFHGFEVLVPNAAISQRAVADYIAALRRAFKKS